MGPDDDELELYGDEGITGHDEVWSREMDDAIREDRERMRSEVDRP